MSNMTLGELRDFLATIEYDHPVYFDTGETVGDLDSYRGDYSHVAIDAGGESPKLAGELVVDVANMVSSTMSGYKGDEYIAHMDTPLWFSEYGVSSGIAVMDVYTDCGKVILETKKLLTVSQKTQG